MKQISWALAIALVALCSVAFAQDKSKVAQGNWEGKFTSKGWESRVISAQIVAQFSGRQEVNEAYRAIFSVGPTNEKISKVFVKGTTEGGKVSFSDDVDLGKELGGKCHVVASVAGDTITGTFETKGKAGEFELKRVEKKPPSLGAAMPQGATMLFDGKNQDAWTRVPEKWPLVDGGAMEVSGSQFATKQEFGSFKLHLEFCVPFLPSNYGQSRGNSGVYIHGRYEIQVLDSFGLEPKDDECGGIYKQAVPKVNACLPPTEWQTYDITFQAPQFDATGKKTKDGELTVEQNGIVIHDHLKLTGPTPGGLSDKEAKTGPLMLQDHSYPVRYRNIWLQPLEG